MGGAKLVYAAAMRRLPLSKVGVILFLLVIVLWAALNLIGDPLTVIRGPTTADDAWEDAGLTNTYPQGGADRRLSRAQQGGLNTSE